MGIYAEQVGAPMMDAIRHDDETWLMRKCSRLCLTLLLMAALALGGCTKLPELILRIVSNTIKEAVRIST